MNKYKYYIFITIALLAVSFILFLKDKPGTLKVGSKIFAITDTTAVTKIRINNGSTELVLERSGLNWQINSSFNANPRAINGLLHLLMNFEVSSPVPKSMKKEVLKSFNHKAVFVSIESSDKVLKAYRVTENDSLGIGSFMMLLGDEEPYVVRIPGFDGRISLFFSSDANVWRDKTIFRYQPADILSIEVGYQSNPQASFAYYFFGPDNIQIKSKSLNRSVKINKAIARNYLMSFASVSYVEQIAGRSKNIFDSLAMQQPYCEIRLTNAAKQVNIVKTFRIPIPGKHGEFNPDKMYAVIQHDTIPVLIKYIDFDPIMKEYKDFVTQ